jgi:hypothetical protein
MVTRSKKLNKNSIKPLVSVLTATNVGCNCAEKTPARSGKTVAAGTDVPAASTLDAQSKPAPAPAPAPAPVPQTVAPPTPLPSTPAPVAVENKELAVKALAPTALKTVRTVFALFEPNAKQVSLSGDFNAWSPDAAPLKQGEKGQWEITLALPPGRYQYKFVVDGQWLADSSASENVFNPFGSLNSVIEIRA